MVPKWLMKELLTRLNEQLNHPAPRDKITRGHLLSRSQYEVDAEEFGYQNIT
jgi:hypothetical protein